MLGAGGAGTSSLLALSRRAAAGEPPPDPALQAGMQGHTISLNIGMQRAETPCPSSKAME